MKYSSSRSMIAYIECDVRHILTHDETKPWWNVRQAKSEMIQRSHFCNNSEHCSMSSIFANVSILWNIKICCWSERWLPWELGGAAGDSKGAAFGSQIPGLFKQFKYCSTPYLPNNSNSQYLFRRTFRTWCQIAPTWWVWHFFIVQLMGRSEIRRKSFYRKAWHCPINLQRKYSHLLFQ